MPKLKEAYLISIAGTSGYTANQKEQVQLMYEPYEEERFSAELMCALRLFEEGESPIDAKV